MAELSGPGEFGDGWPIEKLTVSLVCMPISIEDGRDHADIAHPLISWCSLTSGRAYCVLLVSTFGQERSGCTPETFQRNYTAGFAFATEVTSGYLAVNMRVAIPERAGVMLCDLRRYLQLSCVSYTYIERDRNPKATKYYEPQMVMENSLQGVEVESRTPTCPAVVSTSCRVMPVLD